MKTLSPASLARFPNGTGVLRVGGTASSTVQAGAFSVNFVVTDATYGITTMLRQNETSRPAGAAANAYGRRNTVCPSAKYGASHLADQGGRERRPRETRGCRETDSS